MKLRELWVDGYKNLIDCKVPLGDFNVIVGPNNSGKTNLLQVFHMLQLVLFSGSDPMQRVLRGFFGEAYGSSICHLEAYKERPLTVGFRFDTQVVGQTWQAEYEVSIARDLQHPDKAGFVKESLLAKQPSATGRPKQYLVRDEKGFRVRLRNGRLKTHALQRDAAAITSLGVLYPKFEGLPFELLAFYIDVVDASLVRALESSPEALRDRMVARTSPQEGRPGSIDCLRLIDSINERKALFEEFRANACRILDLADLTFWAGPAGDTLSRKKGEENQPQRMRLCQLKLRGADYSTLDEFSSGTIKVIALLASLFAMPTEGSLPLTCLEEPENGLHPAALERLLRFLQDNAARWPMILTTHSPYLLNGVRPEDVIVAVVGEDGATHFEKPQDRKAINERLKAGFASFGDLLVTSFRDVLPGA